MPQTIKPLEQRFWKKVNKTKNCWLWIGCISKYGYGKIGANGKTLLAPRVSWKIHFGQIPKGFCVLHKCDNSRCVNPKHLFLGTQADNIHDMYKKGRNPDFSKRDYSGEKNPNYGKHWGEDFKENMRQRFSKHFQITTSSGNIIQGFNLRKFAIENKLNIGHLSMLRRGIVKTCKGFHSLITFH